MHETLDCECQWLPSAFYFSLIFLLVVFLSHTYQISAPYLCFLKCLLELNLTTLEGTRHCFPVANVKLAFYDDATSNM